jgi:prepilin-type N-terminal cleavage/methylation domain-containing protein
MKKQRRSGFSLIELLVAIIIIGILVLVLLPIIGNRSEQARIARANADIDNLSEALNRVAIDTGFYVRLMALNDVLRGDDIAFDRDQSVDRVDGLTDYLQSQTFLSDMNGDPNLLFILPSTGDYAPGNRSDIISRLLDNESTYNGATFWGGPYINWRTDNNIYLGVLGRDGTPDDPWGNNYLFFTRAGLFLEPSGELVMTTVGPSGTGGLQTGGAFDTQVFDRATVLSMGPNGLPGDGQSGSTDGQFGLDDDLYRGFGH